MKWGQEIKKEQKSDWFVTLFISSPTSAGPQRFDPITMTRVSDVSPVATDVIPVPGKRQPWPHFQRRPRRCSTPYRATKSAKSKLQYSDHSDHHCRNRRRNTHTMHAGRLGPARIFLSCPFDLIPRLLFGRKLRRSRYIPRAISNRIKKSSSRSARHTIRPLRFYSATFFLPQPTESI
jgi:hypothetical protein